MLTFIGTGSGTKAIASCLEFFARKCKGVEAAIALDDLQGNIEYLFSWGETRLANADRYFSAYRASDQVDNSQTISKTEFFQLRSSAKCLTMLLVRLIDCEIPTEVRTEIEQIKIIFSLILDRTQLQQERDAAAQRLEDLADMGADWLWETDAAGRYTYVSKDLTTLGLDPHTFLGHTRDEIGNQAGENIDSPDWRAVAGRIFAHMPFRNFFHPVLLQDGRRLWLRSSGTPNFAQSGVFLGYKGVCSELTDLIEGERSAREIVERLTAILNALPDLVFEITPEGKYTDFIAGPSEMMAGAQENLPGKTLEEVLPPDVAALSRNTLEDILQYGKCPAVRYRLFTHEAWHWFETAGARKPPVRDGAAPTARRPWCRLSCASP